MWLWMEHSVDIDCICTFRPQPNDRPVKSGKGANLSFIACGSTPQTSIISVSIFPCTCVFLQLALSHPSHPLSDLDLGRSVRL